MDNYKYILRIVVLPDENLKERSDNLVEYCKKYLIDDVTFIINGEERSVGFTTKEIAKKYVDAIAPLSKELKKINVTTSINVWETLGHEDRGRTDVLHFEHMSDSNGYESPMTACILSERWIQNYIEVADYICSVLDVNVFWIEDDFRLHNHAPLNFGGCFCKEHMKRFCASLGEKIDRVEFVKKMLFGGKNKYRETYMKVNMEVYRAVAKRIADALHGKCRRIGLMTSDPMMYAIEGRDNRYVLESFSKNVPCVNRVHLAYYMQTSPMSVQWRFNTVSVLSATYNPKYVNIFPELENFPHGLHVKSAAFTRMQVENSFALIPKGITQNLYNFTGNGVIEKWRYGQYLAELKPYLNKLVSFDIRFDRLKGVIVPISPQGSLNMVAREGANSLGDLLDPENFWGGLLGFWGIGFRYDFGKTFKNEILAIGGQWLRNISYEEAVQLFKDNTILLSGMAIKTLCDLGWADLAGISQIFPRREKTALYTYEQYVGTEKLLGITGASCSAQIECGDVYEIAYSQDAQKRVLTSMFSSKGEKVFDFIVQIGQNILLVPFTYEDYRVGMLHPMHAELIKDYILKHTDKVPMCFEDNVSLYFYEGNDCDYCFLCNYSEDQITEPKLYLKERYVSISCYSRNDVKGSTFLPDYRNDGLFAIKVSLLPLSSLMLVCSKYKN